MWMVDGGWRLLDVGRLETKTKCFFEPVPRISPAGRTVERVQDRRRTIGPRDLSNKGGCFEERKGSVESGLRTPLKRRVLGS